MPVDDRDRTPWPRARQWLDAGNSVSERSMAYPESTSGSLQLGIAKTH